MSRQVLKWALISFTACLVSVTAASYRADIPLEIIEKRYSYKDSKFVEVEGLKAHYRDVGTGEVIILIHGTSASLHTWDGWMPKLSAEYRVISLDLPGFGLTGPFPNSDDYTENHYVQWLKAFNEAVGLSRYTLVGNSLGGHIAWKFAATFPDPVERLMLINPSGFPVEQIQLFTFALARTRGFGWMIHHFTPKLAIKIGLEKIYGDGAEVPDDVVTRYWQLTLREGNRKALVKRLRSVNHNAYDMMSRIQVPVGLMWGTHDRLIPVTHHELFQEKIPHVQRFFYKGIGHVPMEEIPDRTVEDMLRFLRKNPT